MKRKLMTTLALALAVLGAAASDRTVTSGGDIAAALATVINEGGGTVWLEEGTYSLASQTALADIPDGVSIQAKGARENTVIDLANGYGWTLKGATAKIKGVTFVNTVKLSDSSDENTPRFVNVFTGALENCTFKDITFSNRSAVHLAENGRISGCLFTNVCSSAWATPGGVILARGGVITNTIMRACNAYPAPLRAWNKKVTVVDCEMTGCHSTSDNMARYGVIEVWHESGSEAEFIRSTLANNQGAWDGVFYSRGPIAFTECTISNNVGLADHGVFWPGEGDRISFDRCILVHNTGAKSGVGSASQWRSLAFRNCLIAGNVGNTEAGVLSASIAAMHFSFENCTVTGNRTLSGSVHGVSVDGCAVGGSWQGLIYNCIFYGNGNSASDQQLTADAAKVFTSCYPEAANDNANGNISVNPLFMNASGEDYRLNYASPCLDVATDRAATCGTLDLVGTERPQSAKGVSEAWDMGCYEMPPNEDPMAVIVTIGATSGTSPASVTAIATATGSGLSSLVYDWTVTCTTPSGATQTEYKGLTTNELTVADLGPGSYSFKVKVTNSKSETAETTCGDAFVTRPAVCYVKSKAVGVWPYDTPATATSNLVTAIENAGEKVVLAAGTYDAADFGRMTDLASGLDYMAVVDRALSIEGAGPETTILALGGTRAFVLSHASARVTGLSVVNAGSTEAKASGASFRISAGAVSNVVVRDGATWGSSVYVGANARFADAVVTNMTYRPDKQCDAVVVSGGTLEDVSVLGCSAREGCCGVSLESSSQGTPVLSHVTIVGNSAKWGVGGIHVKCDDARIEHCTCVGNVVEGSDKNIVQIDASSAYLSNCRIVNNDIKTTAATFGVSRWKSCHADNMLVAGNICSRGVDVDGWTMNIDFVNLTVTDNTSTSQTNAGIRVGGTDNSQSQYVKTLKNCLSWNNHGLAGEGSADWELEEQVYLENTVLNCCWPEAEDVTYATVNCTAADPKLRDRGANRYYPRTTGSCFNAGTNEAWMATATDLDGNPRLRYDRVDIGCFEAEHDPGLMLLVK